MNAWQYDGLAYWRRPTRTVSVGDVAIGSAHPIRVQSMTTTPTHDVRGTAAQIERLARAGCEIVRVTVPTSADSEALPAIRAELRRRGVRVPLVADIHFTPAVALRAVEHVEKIRINPGNYADKKKFAVREYSEAEYAAELERIARVFSPLVRRAKELGVAMRIGTNHGSLSDRILNRYGDTPLGMVESALEFVRICEEHDYRELILSMKSSNPVVVQHVYRLLAQRMGELGMDYPFHLGVTEAGGGEDGRFKSALGIGALLAEGIGDTVRVSLTEDPVAEVPVAQALVAPYAHGASPASLPTALRQPVRESRDPFRYERRAAREVRLGPRRAGANHTVLVAVPLGSPLSDETAMRREIDRQVGVRVAEETRADLLSVDARAERGPERLAALRRALALVAPRVAVSARVDPETLRAADRSALDAWLGAADCLELRCEDRSSDWARLLRAAREAGTALLFELGSPPSDVESAVDRAVEIARADRELGTDVALLALAAQPGRSPLHAYRLLAARLADAGTSPPIVLVHDPRAGAGDPLLEPAIALGTLLCDGIGDAVRVAGDSADDSRRLAFSVLQASRVRITRTEFISCPSCGRTLFDLEETTARIRQRTDHLKGVKIAIMGCIVNGPGEMADADFGYVGWGEDKIALFVGREMVAKDIPTDQADERLIELIRAHGRWVDPPVPAAEGA